MFAQKILVELDVSHWETWIPVVLLALVAGFFLGRSTRPRKDKSRTRGRYPARTALLPAANAAAPEAPEAPAAPADPFQEGSYGERRFSVRRTGKSVKVAVADVKLEDISAAWVADRSTGGLGLYMDAALEPGTMLYVRPWDGLESVPWVQVTVRSCQKEDDCWKVGCQFVKTPPWSILLLFG